MTARPFGTVPAHTWELAAYGRGISGTTHAGAAMTAWSVTRTAGRARARTPPSTAATDFRLVGTAWPRSPWRQP